VPSPRPPVPSNGRSLVASPWALAVVLVVLALALLAGETVAIEVAYLVSERVGDVVLWVLGPAGAAVLGALAYRAVTGRSVWGERSWQVSDLGWGVLAGLVVIGLDNLVWSLFDLFVSDPGEDVQGWIDGAMQATPWLVAIGVSVATPFGEEVVCRGVLLRGLDAPLPTWVAVAGSSLLFGLLHLEDLGPTGLVHVGTSALAGVVFAVVVLRTGHLIAGVVAHLVVNGVYTVLGLLTGGAVLLTVGPTGDLPAVDLEVGACATAAWWDGEAVDAASEVPCTDPHDLEAAARLELPGGPWEDVAHDDQGVADVADERCLDEFERYVGIDWADSTLDVVAVVPDQERWAAGERELVCLVVPWEADQLEEPAQGSRQ
jgi:membrane protease YdiL (CAAX protease family)